MSTMVNYLVPKSKVFPQKPEHFPEENFHHVNVHKINIDFTMSALILTSGGTHANKLLHFFHPVGSPITRIIKTNRGPLIPIL